MHNSHGKDGHKEDPKTFLEKAKKIANKSNLDVHNFEACVNSKEAYDSVSKTNHTLSSLGVKGTPTFFLNNKKLLVERDLMSSIEKAIK